MASAIDGGVVVVTGASAGIGTELARQLAPRAKALVLVARRTERLETLAAELRAAHPALVTHVMPCDLGDRAATLAMLERVAAEAGDIDVLINNAGFGDAGMFDRSELNKQLQMVDLNITALVLLTHAVLPGMVARRRGAVLNVSSGFGMSYVPGFATYIGTKHFVSGFTDTLAAELAGTGVVVSQLCPGPVKTEFAEVAGYAGKRQAPAWLELSAEDCAKEGIEGIDDGRAMVVPHAAIKLGLFAARATPRWLVRAFMRPAGKYMRAQQDKLLGRKSQA